MFLINNNSKQQQQQHRITSRAVGRHFYGIWNVLQSAYYGPAPNIWAYCRATPRPSKITQPPTQNEVVLLFAPSLFFCWLLLNVHYYDVIVLRAKKKLTKLNFISFFVWIKKIDFNVFLDTLPRLVRLPVGQRALYRDIPCSSPMPFQTYIHSFIHSSIYPSLY